MCPASPGCRVWQNPELTYQMRSAMSCSTKAKLVFFEILYVHGLNEKEKPVHVKGGFDSMII